MYYQKLCIPQRREYFQKYKNDLKTNYTNNWVRTVLSKKKKDEFPGSEGFTDKLKHS